MRRDFGNSSGAVRKRCFTGGGCLHLQPDLLQNSKHSIGIKPASAHDWPVHWPLSWVSPTACSWVGLQAAFQEEIVSEKKDAALFNAGLWAQSMRSSAGFVRAWPKFIKKKKIGFRHIICEFKKYYSYVSLHIIKSEKGWTSGTVLLLEWLHQDQVKNIRKTLKPTDWRRRRGRRCFSHLNNSWNERGEQSDHVMSTILIVIDGVQLGVHLSVPIEF